jgi:UDP-N-acetyl-D-glucosamine dehydrogenase
MQGLTHGHIPATASKHIGRKLANKIRDRSAKLGVIGLGYAGLHLALQMANMGFRVTAIDIDGSKVESINAGISYVADLQDEMLYAAVVAGSICATQSFASLESLDAIVICVPTPLRKPKDPDLAYMMAATEAVHNHLRPGKLIVIESTIYPGATREIVLPVLEKSGLKVGREFFLAYAPKRTIPPNEGHKTRSMPKVIGGLTPRCTALAALLYRQVVERIVTVSSAESAEMVRFLESTCQIVNIALANEMARMCLTFGADVWEVVEAAKPFDFMSFYPEPGGPGDCVPVDWKTKTCGFEKGLFEIAGLIDRQMPSFTIGRIADALRKNKKSLNGSKILVLGIAQKRSPSNFGKSSCLEVIRNLYEKGAVVSYSDPYILSIEVDGKELLSAPTTPEVLRSADCVVILTDHSVFDYPAILAHSQVILDCRSALRKYRAENVIAL